MICFLVAKVWERREDIGVIISGKRGKTENPPVFGWKTQRGAVNTSKKKPTDSMKSRPAMKIK